MASPVFEAMFFGSFNDPKNDPIAVSDVQADAFKAMLEYIYTDKIKIISFNLAFDLCYASKKYMLPFVTEQCTKYLWSDLCSKNACRAYEFAKLFEEPTLQERCLQIICTKTMDVIQDPSFEEVELSTIITILDQDALNVDNELNLFFALNRFAEKHGLGTPQNTSDESPSQPVASASPEINVDAGPSNRPEPPPQQQPPVNRIQDLPTIRDAVKKIRFLTLTPQQFADGPARTSLLSQNEAFALLMNISSPNSIYPMPEGFTLNKNSRVFNVYGDSRSPSPAVVSMAMANQSNPMRVSVPAPAPAPALLEQHHMIYDHGPSIQLSPEPSFFGMIRNERRHSVGENRFYCIRTIQQIREIPNRSVLDASFTFSVDRSVSILGLQICTQIRSSSTINNSDQYSEILYACLLNSHGSRLTYTHSNQRVNYDSVSEILFDRPILIQGNKIYKIGAAFNKVGFYQEYAVHGTVRMPGIMFTFNTGSPQDTIRDGLVRGIIYSI